MQIQSDGKGGFIVTEDTGQVSLVPNDPRNRTYQEVQILIANGATVLPADGPSRIKAEAQRRIINLTTPPPGDQTYWREKQANMIGQYSEIVRDAVVAGGFGNLPSGTLATKAALEGFWDKVKAVRAYSNQLEAAYAADPTTDIYAGWPY